MGGLLGVISDIRRVRTNPDDPMDVRNDPHPDTRPQVVCFFKELIRLALSDLQELHETAHAKS